MIKTSLRVASVATCRQKSGDTETALCTKDLRQKKRLCRRVAKPLYRESCPKVAKPGIQGRVATRRHTSKNERIGLETRHPTCRQKSGDTVATWRHNCSQNSQDRIKNKENVKNREIHVWHKEKTVLSTVLLAGICCPGSRFPVLAASTGCKTISTDNLSFSCNKNYLVYRHSEARYIITPEYTSGVYS